MGCIFLRLRYKIIRIRTGVTPCECLSCLGWQKFEYLAGLRSGFAVEGLEFGGLVQVT